MSAARGQPAWPSGVDVHWLDSVGSTNDEAARLAGAGAPEGTVVWAGRQDKGRGRRGRVWASPPGNLYASYLARPARPMAQALTLGFVAGVAFATAVETFVEGPGRVALKWPNDVLVDGAKLAGVLLESGAVRDGRVGWVVVGLGANILHAPADTPYPATRLADVAVATPEPGALLALYCEEMTRLLAQWRGRGFAAVRPAWTARAHGLGETLEARLGDGRTLVGRFHGLDESGALLLERRDGALSQITAADIYLARALEAD